MPIAFPYTISPGTLADAAQVQANFQAIADKFNGGILDADCSPNMALNGSKLATGTVPGVALQAGAVGSAQLADNSVTTTKIPDANVTTAKLADQAVTTAKIADAAVTGAKLASSFISNKFNVLTGTLPATPVSTAQQTTVTISLSASLQLSLYNAVDVLWTAFTASGGSGSAVLVAADNGSGIWCVKATLLNPTGGTVTFSGAVSLRLLAAAA